MACDEFPTWALLPKKETNVATFLIKYPEYDGRGIKLAIFDSGVDPGAPGLQTTTEGKVKIVDMMDASGAGDVDTSKIVEATDGEIIGLTGRILKIPKTWSNPTNKYHIGVKSGFELYPKCLKERVIKDKKEKLWDPHHKITQAEAARKLVEFNAENTNTNSLPLDKKLQHMECEAAIDVLTNLEKKHSNVGPAYDCIVFHNGKTWRAVVDTSEKGDLESCKLLSTYSENYEYATLTETDRLNYCVNIHDDGNLLEIIAPSSSHGTHVASIASAHFPDCPERNGVAPGAQILSIGIADTRIASMETGTAITRAIIKVINSKCNLINMSFGENAHWSGGRVFELFQEMITKHGIIVCTSAGNRGPAMSTVGTPPVMPTPLIMGIAAYISPEMMTVQYSLREKVPGMAYTWSSRGPGLNFDLGISVCAPGGAITSVPNYLLRGSQLMNGTSMSAPHVSGCITNLLSGLKARGIPYSPFSVRRSVENTALKISTYDALSMGHGLIQVDKAFEHLVQNSECMARDVRFSVTHGSKAGIYLRETCHTAKPFTAILLVEPAFMNNANTDASRKINFQMNLNMTCDAAWVFVPAHLNVTYCARSFSIRIDPTGLTPGEHFTMVQAFDSTCPDKGSVFNFPIAVIKPHMIEDKDHWKTSVSLVLKPGMLSRHFFDVPAGATYASLRLQSEDCNHDASITIHAMQIQTNFSSKTHEFYKIVRVSSKEEIVCPFQVQERRMLELVIAKWWSNSDTINMNFTISFHGLKPGCPVVNIHPGDGVHRLDVTSLLRHEDFLPSITLKNHVMMLRPQENKVMPLKTRDIFPEGRQIYELNLSYHFSLAKAAEVMPDFCLLSHLLYESEFESQLWMLFDCNKQYLASGDAYPKDYCYSAKLEKGEYTVKVHVRHEQNNLLDKLTDSPLLINTKLQSNINMEIYDKPGQALITGKKITSQLISPGDRVPIYIVPLPSDKLPKNCNAGDYLLGTMTLTKDETVKKVDVYPVKFFISDSSTKKNSSSKNSKEEKEKIKEKTPDDELSEAMRDLKISFIPKLQGKSSKDLYDAVLAEDPNHLPTLQARLQSFDPEKNNGIHVKEIITLADKILADVNTVELMAFFGSKTDKKDAANNKTHEKQKAMVVEVLTKKGMALCDFFNGDLSENEIKDSEPSSTGDGSVCVRKSILSSEEASGISVSIEDIDQVYAELQKWIDMTDCKVAHFTEKHAIAHKHYARALKLLLKQQEEKPIFETEKKCIELYRKLGWTHCAEFAERMLFVKYPPSYRLF